MQLSKKMSEIQRDRKTERQKDRKTERQKDRKTERQNDRMTEILHLLLDIFDQTVRIRPFFLSKWHQLKCFYRLN